MLRNDTDFLASRFVISESCDDSSAWGIYSLKLRHYRQARQGLFPSKAGKLAAARRSPVSLASPTMVRSSRPKPAKTGIGLSGLPLGALTTRRFPRSLPCGRKGGTKTVAIPAGGAIDCDIHPGLPGTHGLVPYLDEYWRAHV